MAIEVKIPAVGESISSGVVSVWHKKSGDFVNTGDALFTLETDKVSTEITAETSGLLDTIVPEGQEVKIGEVVATIDDSKTAPPEEKQAGRPKTKEPEAEKKPVAAADDRGRSAKPSPAPDRAEPGPATPATTLSPAVRRIVEEEHLEPERISGTGKDGRLTKGDVLVAAEKARAPEEKIDKKQEPE